MKTPVYLDFETRSEVDIGEAGAYQYAMHPSTSIVCMAYRIGAEGETLVFPPGEVEFLRDLGPDTYFVAHNARFERLVWAAKGREFGLPALPGANRWVDTMAVCAYRGLPLGLDEAGTILKLCHLKDPIGDTLIKIICRDDIKKKGPYLSRLRTLCGGSLPTDERMIQLLRDYCAQDVNTLVALHAAIGELPPHEQEVWELDQAINDAGISVDRETVETAIELCRIGADRINRQVAEITGGAVERVTQIQRVKNWIETQGVIAPDSMAKANVADVLAGPEVPEGVKTVLEARQALGKSSIGKLESMLAYSEADGRARDQFMYHGATTGRWSGRGIMLQNLPRPSQDIDVDLIASIPRTEEGEELIRCVYGNTLPAVSDSLRGMLVAAPGHELIAADFSSIEAVGLAAIAGEAWKLNAFRDIQAGLRDDIYCVAASAIYGYEVKKKTHPLERQVGKIAELASGYQGGIGAWKNFGADKLGWSDDEIGKKIEQWRDAHPATAGVINETTGYRSGGLWRSLDQCARRAVENEGETFSYRDVSYRVVRGPKGHQWLVCRAPSGKCQWYYKPRIAKSDFGNGTVVEFEVKRMGTWRPMKGYGGLWTENLVQKTCRDLLVHAMLLARNELPGQIVLHVHDEIVLEAPIGAVKVEDLEALMSRVPAWAASWPVKAEGWCGRRYRK